MNYAHIEDNIVVELIPEFDPVFPNIPITERFSAEFLTLCELVSDDVQLNYIKTETGFVPPKPIIPTIDEYPTEYPDATVTTPTAQDDNDAMLVDHEYRLTLLELGVTE